MGSSVGIFLIPLLMLLVYLGVIGYVIWLLTRLVTAVERIAGSVDRRVSEKPET
jgi:hypothetical protein